MRRLLVLGAAASGALGLEVVLRHRRLSVVAPELRHRQLYLPGPARRIVGYRHRLSCRRPEPPAEGPTVVREEILPGSDGRPAVRVLIHEPRDRVAPTGALIWIHGGGLVSGSADEARPRCDTFAIDAGVVVVNVDYRLAPDHAYPAAIDDCSLALSWTAEHAEALGIDPRRIAVGGDSAGGGLAACLAQIARDRGPSISGQVLQYPMLDDRTAARPDLDAIVWTRSSNRLSWRAYLGPNQRGDVIGPYAAAARCEDLTGLAPAWIGVGDIDLFHDESVAYAARLRAAGVPCDLHIVAGMYHAADHVVPNAPSMRDFTARMTGAVRDATSGPAGRGDRSP